MKFGTIGAGPGHAWFAREALKACRHRGRGGRRTVPEFGDDVGKGVRAAPVAQHIGGQPSRLLARTQA